MPRPCPDAALIALGLAADGGLVPDGFGAGFSIRGGRIKGSDGCNGISGPAAQTADSLRIGPFDSPEGQASATCPARHIPIAASLRRTLTEVTAARTGPGWTAALVANGRDRVIVQQQRP